MSTPTRPREKSFVGRSKRSGKEVRGTEGIQHPDKHTEKSSRKHTMQTIKQLMQKVTVSTVVSSEHF